MTTTRHDPQPRRLRLTIPAGPCLEFAFVNPNAPPDAPDGQVIVVNAVVDGLEGDLQFGRDLCDGQQRQLDATALYELCVLVRRVRQDTDTLAASREALTRFLRAAEIATGGHD